MLTWLVFIPLLGGLMSWGVNALIKGSFTDLALSKKQQAECAKMAQQLQKQFVYECRQYSAFWICLFTLLVALVIACCFWFELVYGAIYFDWLTEINLEWIELLGVRFHLVLDGFSIMMIVLTIVIIMIVTIHSRKESINSKGLFYLCLMLLTSASMMLFVAADLFLLFFVWEAIAIPCYFLITLWGRSDTNTQNRVNGASKLLMYTQVSALMMLISITSLALVNWNLTGILTFDYFTLAKTPISSYTELLLMIGFFIAFVVRLPLVPFHGWFISAHKEASTIGSMVLSGLLANTSIYGLLRFVIPMFPNASLVVAPIIFVFTLFSVFYVAFVIFNQNDIKKLLAYLHIALTGFITVMIYSGSLLAYQGIVIQMISSSLIMVGFYLISGLLIEQYHSRDLKSFIGLRSRTQYLTTITLFFMLATIGIPGMASFVGNYMMLFGSYSVYSFYIVAFMFGFCVLAISLIIQFQPIFYVITDKVIYHPIAKRDLSLLIFILFILLFIGLYPQLVLDSSLPVIQQIQQQIEGARMALAEGSV